MLKQEENSETPSLPAAQVRVTPEELTAAMARLEARQGGLDGTIPLGDAVQELGLNTTPEELLREIEAGRAHSQAAHSRKPLQKVNRLGIGTACALGLLLFGGMVATFRMSAPPSTSTILPAETIILPAPQATSKAISLDRNMLVKTASSKLVMLSEVGDNQPVECYYNDATFQPYSPNGLSSSWTLIKHGSQVYVCGKMDRMSEQALQKNGADVSNGNMLSGVPVTLPLNGFQVVPGLSGDTEFHAVNIHLDKYAYEKWQP